MTDETRKDPETGSAGDSATAGDQPEAEAPVATVAEQGEGGKDKPAKLHQAVEMRDIGPCKKHIKVTIERDDIARRQNEKFSELMAEANVPGFRPGKAPRRIIERRFGKDVGDQVKAELMLQSLEQLAEDHDIAPLSAPDIDPKRIIIPEDGPMVYEFDVEVRPEFELPNYKGLKLRRPVKTFTEEEVAEEERRILAPYGQLVLKEEGNAQVGDYLIADLRTQDGDRTIGELKDLKIRVEPRLAFRDAVAERFAEQVRGVGAGDTRTVDITMSESAADARVRGKTLPGTLTVTEVKSLRLPELTEEFLAGFGVRTPEQLRERVRVLLKRRLEYQQRQSAREQVLARIAEASEWQLPQDLLARQARRALGRRVMEMRSAGIPEAEIVGRQRLLEQDVLRSTAAALKEHFVLQKIAEVEKLDVNDDDVNDEIERLAMQNDESPRRVRARLEKEDLIDALATEILERKALDLVLESAEYEDVPMGGQEAAGPVATVEEQAVPGKMADLTVPEQPPEQPGGEVAGETRAEKE